MNAVGMIVAHRSQKTLSRAVRLNGIGLHSGKPAQVEISPALTGTGIVFVRTDLPSGPSARAHFSQVTNTQMATTLDIGGAQISTIEHLMAALGGMGISNAIVSVGGPEIPILDGSAWPFVEAFLSVGIQVQDARRAVLKLNRRVELRVGAKWAIAEPADRFEIHGTVEWDHPAIGFQQFQFIEGETPVAEWAKARTFGFLKDVEALQRMGLIQGGSLDNAVVLDQSGILNPDGLRFPDEFARHKVLDAIGDFALAGVALQARFRLHRAGHDIHSLILKEIFRHPDHFEMIEDGSADEQEVYVAHRSRAVAAASEVDFPSLFA